ncbi:MAG: carboxymuconolactone decarboxylase family protein [Rhodospirillaceae bacterium]
MTDEQKSVHDDIVESRGRVGGPFPVMLHNAGLASASQRLGGYARFESQIEARLLEFAASILARYWGAHVEWVAHTRLAAEAGLDAAVIDALRDGRDPDFANADEATVYRFLMMLLETSRVDDATFDACLDVLGLRGVIDLMAVVTHYTVVNMTLNVFHVPAPEGAETPAFGPGRDLSKRKAPMRSGPARTARIDPLAREDMDEEQGAAFDEVAAKGGRLGGPNGLYIRVPVLFRLHQAVGNYLRQGHLTPRLRQLAAIVAARHWNGAYAWGAQARDALKAGVSPEIVDAINQRRTPVFDDEDDRVAYEAAVEIADTGTLSDASFEAATQQLGFNVLLDIVAMTSFYAAVSQCVSVFEVAPQAAFPVQMVRD